MAALAVNFGLAPERALAFFRGKGLKASFDWRDMLREEHDRNYTVAKLLDMDLLADVRDATDRAMAEGKTLKQFRDELIPLLQAKGWWGKQEMTDPVTGEQRLVQLGSARRLQIIYDTNLSTSYAAGRWQSIVANAERAPYLQYFAIDDDRTRAQHLAWNKTILRWDDPWWQTHYPPNGWRCRCSVIQLSERDLRKLGKTGPDVAPASPTREWLNPRTGEVSQVPQGIDPGWDYHPGRDSAKHLAKQALVKTGTAPAELGSQAWAALAPVLQPAVNQAFGLWVDEVLASAQAAGRVAEVGVLAAEEIAWLTERGQAPINAGILIEDRLLVGKKADRHIEAGNALSADEWKQLPLMLQQPEQVLWDVHNQTLVYVFAMTDDTSSKLAVAVNYNLKKQGIANVARTVFKVPSYNLQDRAQYQVIRTAGE